MKKRKALKAQVSLFVIIAIVVVAAVGVFLIIQNSQEIPFESMSFDQQTEIIQENFADCFQLIYKDALDFVGAQGGYYKEPFGNYIEERALYLPVYIYKGELTVPTREFIEDEIGLAVDDNLNSCMLLIKDKFSPVSISYDNSSTEVSITEENVKFVTSFPMTLTSGENTAQIDFSEKEIKSDLDKMINVTDYYVSSQVIDPDFICMDCISEIADKYNLTVSVLNYDEDVIITSVYTNQENAYPASFSFLEVYEAGVDYRIQGMGKEINEEIIEEKELSEEEYNKGIESELGGIVAPGS